MFSQQVAAPVAPSAAQITAGALNYAAVCQAAGFVLFNLERGCWPDAFASYERLHAAMGLPMAWRGFRSTSETPLTLTHHIGRILRAITEADVLAAVASADREFRRARVRYADALETEARHLGAKIQGASRYADNATGAADRGADRSRLVTLLQELAAHRAALSARR